MKADLLYVASHDCNITTKFFAMMLKKNSIAKIIMFLQV
jgi:hypothetical protein